MKWNKTTNKLPSVDKSNDWNKSNRITKDVWTYSEFGMRVGRYFYNAEMWTVNGVTSSNSINITHWMPLPALPKED